MMKTHKRLMLSAAILSAGLLVSGAVARPVAAATTTCRSDPQVFLSNNYKFQMSASLPVDASQIREIDYTLNAPAGTTVTGTVWTANAPYDETLSYQATNSNKHYNSTTTVYLKDGSVLTVSAQDQVNYQGSGSGGSVFGNNSGHTGQPIPISVTSN